MENHSVVEFRLFEWYIGTVVRMRNMKMDAVLSKVPKGGQLDAIN